MGRGICVGSICQHSFFQKQLRQKIQEILQNGTAEQIEILEELALNAAESMDAEKLFLNGACL